MIKVNSKRNLKFTFNNNDILKLKLLIEKNKEARVKKFKSKNIKNIIARLSKSFFKKRINSNRLSNILKKLNVKDFKNTSFKKLNKLRFIFSLANKFLQILKFIKVTSFKLNQFKLNKRTINLTNYF